MAIKFDIETGLIFIRNFDQGVIETLGGYIDELDISTSTGSYSSGPYSTSNTVKTCRKGYYVDVPAVSPMPVPVIFNKPFAASNPKIYPSILITRGDATPAMNRWHSVCATQYRIPGKEADFVAVTLNNGDVVSGYTDYEQLPQAMPFDLPYTISVYAKYEREAIPMLKKILSVYKPYSRILIKDSLSFERSYTVFNESGFTDISELIDVSDRVKAYQVEIRIEGELDLNDPEINPAALEFIGRTNSF